MADISLQCRCGEVRGLAREVSPDTGTRLICYCDDCQAFAGFLREKGGPDVLKARGGTDIFQMTPAKVEITRGAGQLRCIRLRPKGILRFYTACCHTPVGNTLSAGVPFVGVIHSFMGEAAVRDEFLGPVRYRVMGAFAHGAPDARIHRRFPLTLLWRTISGMLFNRLRGLHKPSPFFEGDGAPVSAPEVLS